MTVTPILQPSATVSDDVLRRAAEISLADLLESDLLTLTVVRTICIVRKELLLHQLTEPEDQRLEAQLTGLYHAIGVDLRNAAFFRRHARNQQAAGSVLDTEP